MNVLSHPVVVKLIEWNKSITGTYVFGAMFHAIPSYIVRQLTCCFGHVVVNHVSTHEHFNFDTTPCLNFLGMSDKFISNLLMSNK